MLKVYSWTWFRNGAQTREVMAAHSAAEVMRATGMTRTDWQHSGGETGNREEVALARSRPGTVYWAPLNDALRGRADWHEVE